MSSLPDPEPGRDPVAADPAAVDDIVERLRDHRGRDLDPAELMELVDSHKTIGESTPIDPTPPQPPSVPHDDVVPDPTPTGATVIIEPRRWVRVLRVGAAVVAIVMAYYLISLYQVWSAGRADQQEPVDAIVVMGAAQYDGRPSPQLAARLDHVAELWPEGYAPLVIVTGGNIPGDRFTEASASASYLIDRGVPDEAILLEDEGSNSFETLSSVAEMLDELGLDEVLIVTDPYHALRSRETAEELGLSVRLSSTDTSVVRGSDAVGRHMQEAAGVAVGRIIGFERLASLVD